MSELTDDRLEPCPFCGSPATLENLAKPSQERRMTVGCSNEDCFVYLPSSPYFPREAEAIAAWNRRAAASTSTEGAGVKMPVLTVFDWAYYKDGEERYARTPERAKQLMDEGVKVTPVYTIDGYRDFLPILNPPAPKVTTDEAEERG